jgi:2-iminobutanoate/2-iminopropanoate deaminase
MQERKVVNVDGVSDTGASAAVVAGGLIFTSAVAGVAAGAPQTGAPDVRAQTKSALEQLRGVLTSAGSSLGQTAAVTVYLRAASDFEAMNGVYREAFGDRPPTRTTVVTGLPPGQLVRMSAVAVPDGASRETLHPAGWIKSPRPYSYIVRAGNFVFFSGLVSRRGTNDQPVPGPVSTQTSTILDNAGTLLRTAGLTFADVVSARVFLTDDSIFEAMNDEYRKYFTTNPPARATGVTGLMGNDALVEITLIASIEPKQVIGPPVSPSLPLSSAVRAGDFLFLSGVLGNTDTNTGDLTAQTREVVARTRRTLEGVGLSFGHVVDNLVYLTDVWQQRRVDEVTREIFPTDPPARTVVGAKLVTRAGLVEMMMTAVAR